MQACSMRRRLLFSRWVCLVPWLLVACGDSESSPGTLPMGSGDSAVGERHLAAVGVQLYTVRAAMEQDFEGTLRSLAAMGYSEVEFAGLFGRDPAQVAELLAELNLSAVGSHVTWDRFRSDPDAAIEETLALGAQYLVFPWLPDAERRTLAQWQGWVTLLNQVGQAGQARGLELAYHNHDFEFVAIDGTRPIDLLLDGIDRSVVTLELDLYWLAKAGAEPSELFERYPGGFPLVHAKDMRRSDQSMADVGQGDLDFAAVFAQADRAGVAHVIVEHDEPAEPMQSVQNSLTYLKALTY
jgi:sugar phosphate isomerase/epimerase